MIDPTKTAERQTGWFLPRSSLSALAADELGKVIEMARAAHAIDVVVRVGGTERRLEADWIKYLRPGDAAQIICKSSYSVGAEPYDIKGLIIINPEHYTPIPKETDQ